MEEQMILMKEHCVCVPFERKKVTENVQQIIKHVI